MQVRIRRLAHALCLQRRVDDAFAVIETAEEMGVDADVATCVDLIALAMQVPVPYKAHTAVRVVHPFGSLTSAFMLYGMEQCHCPHRVPTVFACISRRNYALDVQSAHTLVRLLSQIDAFQEALQVRSPLQCLYPQPSCHSRIGATCLQCFAVEQLVYMVCQVLNSLPENGTRADVGSYTELVSTAFRAGLGDACMALIKELLKVHSNPFPRCLSRHFLNHSDRAESCGAGGGECSWRRQTSVQALSSSNFAFQDTASSRIRTQPWR